MKVGSGGSVAPLVERIVTMESAACTHLLAEMVLGEL